MSNEEMWNKRRTFMRSPDPSFGGFSIFQQRRRSAARPFTSQGFRTTRKGLKETTIQVDTPATNDWNFAASIIIRPKTAKTVVKTSKFLNLNKRKTAEKEPTSTHRYIVDFKSPRMTQHLLRRIKTSPHMSRFSKDISPVSKALSRPYSAPINSSSMYGGYYFGDDKCNRNNVASRLQDGSRGSTRDEISHIQSEFCEVLGVSSCPDCLRKREQNNHHRQCTSQVPADANTVYNVAIIEDRLPHHTRNQLQQMVEQRDDDVTNVSYRKHSSRLTYFNPSRRGLKSNGNLRESTMAVTLKEGDTHDVKISDQVVNQVRTRLEKNKDFNLIPSDDFFVDMKDFKAKLRLGGKSFDRARDTEYLQRLKTSQKPPTRTEQIKDKSESDEKEKLDPVILCNNKSRYIGVEPPPVGVRASSVIRKMN